ncbi:hypothetical protein [Ilumatobacter sp.]|uniref:hypothetical protein n=1 Tax=Ilumatobacter sp. TaxID=1967498 RepID=UPI003B51E569
MKTRTLLLMSVAVGLVILIAGGVLLVRLAGGDDAEVANRLGDTADVGDATVTVRSVDETPERVEVEVEVGGVQDGLDGIALLTGDESLAPVTDPAPGRCTELTVEPRRCRLAFDTAAAAGSTRVLLIVRGEDRASWSLES